MGGPRPATVRTWVHATVRKLGSGSPRGLLPNGCWSCLPTVRRYARIRKEGTFLMSEITVYERVCGVDVAQQTLEIELTAGAWHQSLASGNDAAGFAQLIALCRQHAIQIVVMEATGGYERALVRALAKAGLAVAVVNPSRIRFYALAQGLLAKTDRVDARLIARFARHMVFQPTAVRSAVQEELLALTARKAQLLDAQTAEQNRLQQQALPRIRQSIQRQLRFLEREIAQLETRMDELVRQDPQLQIKAEVADALKGVGRASAVALVTLMPELGTLSSKQAAALAGLAPFNRDSGKHCGERHIFGGRAAVRCVLYMCTLSAVRFDATLKTFYERLRAAGKCTMKALTACMRKLLVILNARIRDRLAALAPEAREAAVAAAGG